jgi:hypothetical protein
MHALRPWLIGCALFLAVASTVIATRQRPATFPSKNTHDTIEADRDLVFDLGVVEPNSTVKRSFELRNDSESPWTLSATHDDCSCVVEKLEPATVLPGQSSTLHIEYKASNAGRIGRRIALSFEEKKAPIVVHVTGLVRPWAEARPETIELGELLQGGQTVRDVELTAYAPHSLDITTAASTHPWVNWNYLAGTQRKHWFDEAEVQSHRVQIVAVPPKDLAPGIYRGHVAISEDDTLNRVLRVHWHVEVVAPVRVVPRELFFGVVAAGQRKTETLRVKVDPGLGKVEPKDVRFDCELPSLSFHIDEGDNPGEIIVRAEFRATADSGIVKGECRVSVPGVSSIAVPFTVSVQPEEHL